jgi:hypothetical protein
VLMEARRRGSRSLREIGLNAAFVALLFGASSAAPADSAVILGSGHVGNWITTGFVANPNASSSELIVAPSPILSSGGASTCSLPEECPSYDVSFPALGSGTLPFAFTGFKFGTVYVTQSARVAPAQAFPIVQASLSEQDACRSANTLRILQRSVDIPVILLSKLIAANLSTLNFPRVMTFPEAIGRGVFTNLVLGNIQRADGIPGEDLPLLLELFDFQGNLVGSTSLTLSYGETRVVGDVSFLGAPGFFYGGQLRVTRVSGKALMWGILYTNDDEFGITASTGANLSP